MHHLFGSRGLQHHAPQLLAASVEAMSRSSKMVCMTDGLGSQSRHFFGAVAQLWAGGGGVEGNDDGKLHPLAGRRQFASPAHEAGEGAEEFPLPNAGSSSFEEMWKSKRSSLGLSSEVWRGTSVPLEEQKVLQVGVIGVPNAGKSTLTNYLIGSKVSAVSPKTNTTAVPMLGAFTEGVSQVVLHDTPGVVDSRHYKSTGQRQKVRSAWTIAQDCDMLLLMVDIHRQVEQEDPRIARLVEELASGKNLGDHPPPVVMLLNKIDKVEARFEGKAQNLAGNLEKLHSFEKTFWVSAAKGYGVPALREYLVSNATLGNWILDSDQATDMPQPKLAAEVVREKVFRRLRQELPYEIDVVPKSYEILKDGSLLFRHNIFVPTESVRRMVIGRKGAVIGEIGITARAELSVILKNKVHLYLEVKLI